MSGKEKLKFGGVLMGALLLLGGAGSYLYSKWELNNKNLDELRQRYTEIKTREEKNANASAGVAVVSQESGQKEAATLRMTFRAIGLNNVSQGADQEIAFNVLNEIKSSAYFDSARTIEASDITAEVPISEPPVKTGAPPGTFSFKIVAKLKRPLTL
jgi:hypothetical protein